MAPVILNAREESPGMPVHLLGMVEGEEGRKEGPFLSRQKVLWEWHFIDSSVAVFIIKSKSATEEGTVRYSIGDLISRNSPPGRSKWDVLMSPPTDRSAMIGPGLRLR